AGVGGRLALVVVAGPQPALELAAHALERGRGDDAPRGGAAAETDGGAGGGGDAARGGAADAEQHVGAGLRPGGGDGAGHVAVGDEPDAGAGGADLGDEVGVPVPVQNNRGDATAPSGMSRMRAPVARISAMRSVCRSRSSTTAVMSRGVVPLALASASMFSATERVMSITPTPSGPTAIFS